MQRRRSVEALLELVDLPEVGVAPHLRSDAELALEPPEAASAPTRTPIATATTAATAMTSLRMP